MEKASCNPMQVVVGKCGWDWSSGLLVWEFREVCGSYRRGGIEDLQFCDILWGILSVRCLFI